MSSLKFTYPPDSFEYKLYEQLELALFGAVTQNDIVNIATRVHIERAEKITTEAQQVANREAGQTISVTATRIQEATADLGRVAADAIEKITLAYADAITTLKSQLDDTCQKIEDVVAEVLWMHGVHEHVNKERKK